ncbi:uncharacterized protein SETTUDRAFT_161147 [Exserohilum turcica Et28A]|uniref:Uncharacterized protein n=1 Tax=Exserohilum turcicum (strain 28A) TaxID=671987 RepID=R0ISL8_EXST2|nr:uncharacterized protein SETTUDRAFT_161147 [Exserohilum turcica Et28A]EOA87616.1 hypothetical protein SETTUDRAFT_161147 [Exserohilum turcica Et28A]
MSPTLHLADALRLIQSDAPVPTLMSHPTGVASQTQPVQQMEHKLPDHSSRTGEYITRLEQESAELKHAQNEMTDCIRMLEHHNAQLGARRKELVAQLSNLRTLNQDADNAFLMRKVDVEPDNLEAMLGIHNTMITTAINHQQHMLAQFRARHQAPVYVAHAPQYQAPVPAPAYRHAYPAGYSEHGYCYAHNSPYCCRICSK